MMAESFKEKWKTGFNYSKATPVHFLGESLGELEKSPMLQKNIYYCLLLYQYSAYLDKGEDLNDIAKKEVTKWECDGGLCIYLSALLYSLLIHDKLCNENEIRYCQGLYRHECRTDNILGQFFGKNQYGLHAWLELNSGAILDIAIKQEEQFFEFKERPYITGKVPEGLELIGFREVTKTAKDYARMAAKSSGMKYNDWIDMHSREATKAYLLL